MILLTWRFPASIKFPAMSCHRLSFLYDTKFGKFDLASSIISTQSFPGPIDGGANVIADDFCTGELPATAPVLGSNQ